MHLVLLSFIMAGGRALAQSTPTDPGDLTITEFMGEPGSGVANYNGEWFEIYNASGRNLDLDGLEIQGETDDIGFTVDETTTLGIGEFFVFGASDDTSVNGNIPVDWVYERTYFPLAEAADTIKLVYGGVTLDKVTWNSADWHPEDGVAYQANNNAFDLEWANDLPQNWCSADQFITVSGFKGTPGEANDWCDGSNDDTDGDGYNEAGGDCDDDDAYVNPDAIDGSADPYGNANDDADCDGVRDDGDVDNDGDGYSEIDGDCDDDNIDFFPGANEILDGEDNDCNGCVDDRDDDNDGWTECETDEMIYCGSDKDKNDSWCEDNPDSDDCVYDYDCDDGDNLVYPCAIEKEYNGVDDDCNGYDLCDVDGDGYESDECPEDSLQYPEKDPDCDDGNPDVHPGAAEEEPPEPPDGLDNDCNGVVDDNYLDADDDGYTVADGDCWDDPYDERAALVHPGAEEICTDLLDNDCNGLYNDGCFDPTGYAFVRGGGVCGVTPGSAAGGSLLVLLFSMLLAGNRRRCGG